ncbi:MAG: N-acetylglucosamine-6-phosphate deacetylase [Chloroflexi bacterium]|nr:N-acetylglucosamine-6-phosphate deacetylase [Chloroflexota bacterium]
MKYIRGEIYTATEHLLDGAVIVAEGHIRAVGLAVDITVPFGAEIIRLAEGERLIPGLIDIHVNGGGGYCFARRDTFLTELESYARWLPRGATTGFLLSIAAPTHEELAALGDIVGAAAVRGTSGARVLGVHMEGPFLNPQRKGAFSPDWLRPPDVEEAEEYLAACHGQLKVITIAPDLTGSDLVAQRLHAAGVVVALGHTNASFEVAQAALQGDFTHVTHAFNAMRGFQHRDPGTVGAVLTSERVTAELIPDGVHVHPGAMQLLLRCLGTDRVILVTDAMAAAGLGDGEYSLFGQTVRVRQGKATLSDGTIAGSVLTMNQAVCNVAAWLNVPFGEAVKMASLNPARVLGLADRLGSIAVGKQADLAVLDAAGETVWTMVRGEFVYQREGGV